MAEVETVKSIATWSNHSQVEDSERQEFDELVNGRSMLYAPVDNPKSFCAEMKHSTGRLMDFNKGT